MITDHTGFIAIAALLGFELVAESLGWQTFSMGWWWLGRHIWAFRWIAGPAFATWLWFHLTIPMFKGIVR